MAAGLPCRLVGLGHMTLSADGAVTGEQRSSVTPLKGSNARHTHAAFAITGRRESQDGAFARLCLRFECLAADCEGQVLPIRQTLDGTFDVLDLNGGTRFWFISSGALNVTTDPRWADEVVSGEAEWQGLRPDY
jgi:hypothetical protein